MVVGGGEVGEMKLVYGDQGGHGQLLSLGRGRIIVSS